MSNAPKCKICGSSHFGAAHVWSGQVSPKPAPARPVKPAVIGVDLARPGGDQTAVVIAERQPDGKVTMTEATPSQRKAYLREYMREYMRERRAKARPNP